MKTEAIVALSFWTAAVAKITAFQQAQEIVRNAPQRIIQQQRWCLGGRRSLSTGPLFMGGYASESDDRSEETKTEIGGRSIDRSKTHMIFGIRCVETQHPLGDGTTSVVGLQPLQDLEDYWGSDGTVCNENVSDHGRTLSVILDHLLRSDVAVTAATSDSSVLELVEVGADPMVSVALAKLLSCSNDTGPGSRRVVVCHPDEQRLRVLEHAYKYFNEQTATPCAFQLEPLGDHLPFVWFPSASKQSVVVFTSPTLVANRLDEAVAGMVSASMIAGNTGGGGGSYRILVPSTIVAPEQLERYEYKVVAGGDAYGSNLWLLEILCAR